MAKHLPCTVRSFRNARLLRNRRIFLSTPIPGKQHPVDPASVFKPENFFAYTDSTLKAVISALRRVEEEKHFTAPFLLKYGIPLWNFTYQLTEEEETCIFVPLYRLDKPHCIDAIWLLHIKDGWMKFLPLKRDDELIRESDQVFIFDLLSYLVFGEENAQGLHIQASCPDPFGNNRHPMLGCIYRT